MNQATERISNSARRLLSEGKARVVIGYSESGRGNAYAFFASEPEQCDKLVFDERCHTNLATYLTKPEVRALGPAAIVAKSCDVRAINVLVKEGRVKRESLHVIGVECPGMDKAACAWCESRTPEGCDEVIPMDAKPAAPTAMAPAASELPDAPEDRWKYWMAQFERCIRCYACRAVCPVCHCTRCLADKNLPQAIETSATARGNLEWNMTRAFHMAGRCVECGACEEACPVDLPLMAFTRSMRSLVSDRLNCRPGADVATPSALSCFREDDREEFFQ